MLRKPYAFAGLLAAALTCSATVTTAQIAPASRYEASAPALRNGSGSPSVDNRVAALRTEALAYSARGDARRAQRAVDGMILARPRYEAQAGDTPAFNAMVASAQARYSSGELTRGRKGVPQFVYTGLVVGMSALTIGLGVSAASAQ